MMSIWTDFARSYDRVLRAWSCHRALTEKACRHLAGARHVLEQGCGTGIVAEALARAGAHVDAIDNNADMLAAALRCAGRLASEGIAGRITLREADALRLPFANRSFDGVVSNNVIFYVDDPVQLLTEARRVLRAGGRLVISGPQPAPDLALLDREIRRELEEAGVLGELGVDLEHFEACSRELKRSGMPNTYRLDEIVALLHGVGFQDVLEADDTVYHGQSWFVAVR